MSSMFTGNPPPAIIGRAAEAEASRSPSVVPGISSSPQVRNAIYIYIYIDR